MLAKIVVVSRRLLNKTRRKAWQPTSEFGRILASYAALTTLSLRCTKLVPAMHAVLFEQLRYSSSLTSLDASFNTIRVEGAKGLAKLLRGTCTLRELDVTACQLEAQGVGVLCDAMLCNVTLTSLKLGRNHAAGEGAQRVAQVLLVHKKLTLLDLSINSIADEGLKALSTSLTRNTTLRSLNLAKNGITVEGVQALTKRLWKSNSSLENINLYPISISDMDIMKFIRKNQSLRTAWVALAPLLACSMATQERPAMQALVPSVCPLTVSVFSFLGLETSTLPIASSSPSMTKDDKQPSFSLSSPKSNSKSSRVGMGAISRVSVRKAAEFSYNPVRDYHTHNQKNKVLDVWKAASYLPQFHAQLSK